MSILPIQGTLPVDTTSVDLRKAEARKKLAMIVTPMLNIQLSNEEKREYKLKPRPPSVKAQEVFNREMQRLKERRAIEGGTFS